MENYYIGTLTVYNLCDLVISRQKREYLPERDVSKWGNIPAVEYNQKTDVSKSCMNII